MFLHIVWICFSIGAATAAGEFIVLHYPNSVQFLGNKTVNQSFLKEIFSVALGMTMEQKANWDGMKITNPLTLPEAVVCIAVEGVDSLNSLSGKHFPLNGDEIEEATWQALSHRLEESDGDRTLVRFNLGDGLNALGHSALGELKPTPIDQSSLGNLSLQNTEDGKFLEEVQLLQAISKKIPSTITTHFKPDVYWLVVSRLRNVIDLYGKESASSKDAKQLLNDALHKISEAFARVYKNGVLIATFTNDDSQVRRTRSTNPSRTNRDADLRKPNEDKMNLGKRHNENYPVIFNIILWFGVTFFFSLLAICIAIASMDPGRDSIIYRMTSNRMKKEN